MMYGEDITNQVTFYKWYTAFEKGRESIADEPRGGRLLTPFLGFYIPICYPSRPERHGRLL